MMALEVGTPTTWAAPTAAPVTTIDATEATITSVACARGYDDGWLGLVERHGGDFESFVLLIVLVWAATRIVCACVQR